MTSDLGNKCWAVDLKLQKQWWLASGPGGIETDIWYYKNIFLWIVSTDTVNKYLLTAVSTKN